LSIPLTSLRLFAAFSSLFVFLPICAQQPSQSPAIPATDKPATLETPAQIELLETRVRFESNGDSRKEVHARVHINSELGVRQFSHLSFDFNRSFEQIEIPLVHITHKSGGSADILPSAITDQPSPAVSDAPAYQDIRVKSVRILGLEPADILEYRVVTTASHHPLAPDFWLDHSFDRTGVVSEEHFELDLPSSREAQVRTQPANPQPTVEKSDEGDSARIVYHWRWTAEKEHPPAKETSTALEPDVVVTTFPNWQRLADRLKMLLEPFGDPPKDVSAKAVELVHGTTRPEDRINAIYTFVSQKIRTVDVPVGSTGFKTREASEILSSGYGTPEDKHILFAALGNSFFGPARAGLIAASASDLSAWAPRPDVFDHLLTLTGYPSVNFWLDLNLEVAPPRMIASQLWRKRALVVGPAVSSLWREVDEALPFASRQTVRINATLASDGTLNAQVKYSVRGDNELLLRIAFHQSPRDKWKDVAQLLALSDGFRGKVISASASDPYSTKQPFSVEYDITQTKFVDWSKKSVRIPALLPQLGIPDLPSKSDDGAAALPIDLGTPLDVDTRSTLRLPPGTSVEVPTGTVVDRDYATFASRYDTQNGAITATRHINFLHRQVPADRAPDYAAFLHAVQTDQSQRFTLTHSDPAAAHAAATPSAHIPKSTTAVQPKP
jgi:Domain of Unknown Function with PDB structure (DUF3857)